jgi:inosine-uridine nucleoside N-ribohydrolase
MAAKKAIWLNCDPGHDDAVAILLAGQNQTIELLGISTEAGNQTVEKTTQNALRMLYACGLSHIPVAKGRPGPLLRASMICPEIHGESGLDGPTGALIPTVSRPLLPDPAPVAIYQAVSRHYAQWKERVTIVNTGALTSVALALLTYSDLKDMARVVLMGGAMGAGNTSPVAEFNIQIDPEAASIVFNSGIEVTMVPLEVTHTALVSPDVLDFILSNRHTPFTNMMRDMMTFFAKTYQEVFGFASPPLHDPLAVAYVIAPEIFTTRLLRVDVECGSSLCAGQTVCDIWEKSTLQKNVNMCTKVDLSAFWALLRAAIEKASIVSPLLDSDR